MLSDRLKEVKSLVLEYKENKDKEIKKVNSDLSRLKRMVDQNKIEYETMLDKATQSIEKFIEKSSQNKPLQ
jgi:cell division protein ZapA